MLEHVTMITARTSKIALRSGIVTPFIHAEELVAPTLALPTRTRSGPLASVELNTAKGTGTTIQINFPLHYANGPKV